MPLAGRGFNARRGGQIDIRRGDTASGSDALVETPR